MFKIIMSKKGLSPTNFVRKYKEVYHILENQKMISELATVDSSCGNFEEDYQKHYVRTTPFQKALLALGSGYMVFKSPFRVDMSTCFSETTGQNAAKNLLRKIECSEEGRKILADRPRVNSKTIDKEKLKKLPEDTLGKAYYNFLNNNNITSDSRHIVRFVDDINTAYAVQRYREVHDFVHTILDMPPNTVGETTVKWVEAFQTKLPYCIMGVIFGPLSIKKEDRGKYFRYYAPWGFKTAKNSKFLYDIYFEKRLEQPISELRKELGIKPLIIKDNKA